MVDIRLSTACAGRRYAVASVRRARPCLGTHRGLHVPGADVLVQRLSVGRGELFRRLVGRLDCASIKRHMGIGRPGDGVVVFLTSFLFVAEIPLVVQPECLAEFRPCRPAWRKTRGETHTATRQRDKKLLALRPVNFKE